MKTFETVSFHIVKPCNMGCKFCYATFEDMTVKAQMSLTDAREIIFKLFEAGVQKITFAGGEPMLYRYLDFCIIYSKSLGMTTSIITNGSLITEQWLIQMQNHLDWIGVSVDSINDSTNHLIGRTSKRNPDYVTLISLIKRYGYRLKINTVVNAYNKNENFNDFIEWSDPDRWKVFQALRVEGQNDEQFEEIKVSNEDYALFTLAHAAQKSMVVEDNEAMTGSYLLIDPLGRLFENSKGKHTYSDSLIGRNIEYCLEQIDLDRDMFIKRGGIYEWK